MNFKALALGSVLALGTVFGGMTPAEAATSTCWIGAPSETVDARYCDHYLPYDGNHVVYMNGSRFEFNLYTDGDATISVDGARAVAGTWVYHEKGGIQVTNNSSGYFFIFERN